MNYQDAKSFFENFIKILEKNGEKEILNNQYCASAKLAIEVLEKQIDNAPTIDAEPVRHGHWIICSDGYYPYCSKCKQEPDGKNMTNYCPHCGAKMDEVNNNERD